MSVSQIRNSYNESHPVLGNPYYHQPTDLLETVNKQLVFEATKMNVASMMALS